jgi:diguanylate cyclase (GGDEF)-like protein
MDASSEGRRRVLIVDDQPANIHVLGEALREGYELYFATSGGRALELAAETDADLVLLDVMMPGMDGFEVCARLQADERTRRIPVIFVTALGEVHDETRGFEAGGVDYITKPVSAAIVRARVRTHIELKEARDRLEQLASADGLTGVANRRRFDAGYEHEWRRAARSGHWLSLALLDVDYFKRFNDRYGHARGDECLRLVAAALASACRRPADLVARYGGEEFALVLPETDAGGARALIGGVLARLQELAIEHADSACAGHVTVSVGAVSLVPSEAHRPEDVLDRADRLLYAAKEAGRRQGVHLDLASGRRETVAPPDANSEGALR